MMMMQPQSQVEVPVHQPNNNASYQISYQYNINMSDSRHRPMQEQYGNMPEGSRHHASNSRHSSGRVLNDMTFNNE